METEMEER